LKVNFVLYLTQSRDALDTDTIFVSFSGIRG